MKFYSKNFERRLRRKVKRSVRISPSLRKEVRRTRRSRPLNSQPFIRLLGSGFVAVLTSGTFTRTGHLETALAFLGVWLLAWISFLVLSLAYQLHASPDLAALTYLPVPDRSIFRRQLECFLRKASWLMLDLVLGLLALAMELGFTVWLWLAIVPIALLCWLLTLAATGLALTHCPRLPYRLITGVVAISGFFLLIAFSFVGTLVLGALDQMANYLLIFIPMAWPLSLFRHLQPAAPWSDVLLLLPTLALIWTIKDTLNRLICSYQFAEPIIPEISDRVPEDSPGISAPGPADAAPPRRVGITTIEEFARTRGFLPPVDWAQLGWMERQLWRWLNPRERAVAEFIFPDGPALTLPWRRILKHLGIGLAVGFVFGWAHPAFAYWILPVTMAFVSLRALASYFATGNTFKPIFCSGVNIHLHAVYPLGYRELSVSLLKFSTIQLPILAGLLIVSGLVVAHLTDWTASSGALTGLKVAILLGALRFIFITLAFSSASNDSSTLRFRTLLRVTLGVILAIGFLALSVAALIVPNPVAAAGSCVGAVLNAWLAWWIYGRMYDANRFDIMSLPRQ